VTYPYLTYTAIALSSYTIAALATIACVPPAGGVWVAEPNVYDAAVAAADDWCRASDGAYCPAVAPDGPGRPIGARTATAGAPDGQCGWARCRGESSHDPVTGSCTEIGVRLDRITAGECPRDHASETEITQAIIAHELGHDAGLSDSDDPLSIMSTGTAGRWILGPSYLDGIRAGMRQ
jgi:hypothetical protein